MPTRTLSNWAASFLEYTAIVSSPEIFRRWTAYSILAGALERRAWTRLSGEQFFPNLIVLLVAAPGIGKTQAIKHAASFWAATGLFNIAPSGMTKAAFVDQIGFKLQYFEYNGVTEMYNPMLIAATEFGTLLPDYDTRFLNVVNDIYDCLPFFEDKTRKTGTIKHDKPHVSIIAGTQPQYLGDLLPEAAYGMGFMARVIMIYAGKRVIVPLFKSPLKREKLRIDLINDLKIIGKLVGEFEWEEEAQDFTEDWNENVEKDAPTHGKLLNYNTRRMYHCIKLAMAVSVSRNDELIITLEDIQFARDMLVEAEKVMPEIFKEMTSSSDAKDLEEMHMFLFGYCNKYEVEIVPEHKLTHFISKRVAVNKIKYFIDTMLISGMMKVEGSDIPGGQRKFRPLHVSLYGK